MSALEGSEFPGRMAGSHGLWDRTAISAPQTPPLDRDIAVDVAVVGAGYTGLSVALHLAEEGGVSVAVLEASEVGFGASGRNAGLVNAGAWIPPDELPRRLDALYGKRLLQTLGDGPGLVFDIIRRYGIDCEAVRRGNLHCAVGAGGLADIRERARQWAAHGVQVSLLDALETARLVGTDAYSGALLDPRTGTIQPLSYARGLARAALTRGVAVHGQTAVTQVLADGGRWRLCTTGGHHVTARHVVVATNTAQSSAADAWPQLQTGLVRLPYFNVATKPLPSGSLARILPQGHGAWDTAAILSSYRLDSTGRLIYGSVGALTPGALEAHVHWTRRSIGKLFPELEGIEIEYQWYGWIDTTAHHLPYLHRLADGIWALCGYNGRGIAPGTILGRELAWMLLGKIRVEDMSLPVMPIQPVPLRRLREALYRAGSTMAHACTNRL